MRIVQTGITRTVFVGRRWTVKVPTIRNGWPLFLAGLQANMTEVVWSHYKDAFLTPNPVQWNLPGGWLNVYRTAINVGGVEGWEALDWEPFGDKKAEHLGFVDGEMVLLDYAMPPRPFSGCHGQCGFGAA
jgi:hypothetical protein